MLLFILFFQWITKMIFALLFGVIYFRLNEKDYNPQTVITDRLYV